MPQHLTQLNVFLASSSGLDEERSIMKSTIEDFNKYEAVPAGFYFKHIMWEEISPTRKRPQERINEDLRSSDYFALLIWNRWGSFPGETQEGYKTAIEEEFRLAEICCDGEQYPMTDIAVFFKAPDESQLKDPGPQLLQVLDFKKELDENKKILYAEFDSRDRFKNIFRGKLIDWLRELQASNGISGMQGYNYRVTPSPQFSSRFFEGECHSDHLICIARELECAGELTEAEKIYARASEDNSPSALREYGRYLLRIGRINQAQHKFELMLEIAEYHSLEDVHARALADLGVVYRTTGNPNKALELFHEALSINTRIDNQNGQANSLGNIGITLRMKGDIEQARNKLCDAFSINMRLDNKKSMARNLDQIGIIYRIFGNLEIAEECYKASLEINREIDNKKGVFDNKSHLATVYRLTGDLDRAEREYREVINFNEKHSRKRMLAEALGNVGTIYRCRGDFRSAENFYHDSLAINAAIGCLEGMAKQYAHLAMLAIRNDDHDQANSLILKSLEINQALGSKEGLAANYSHRGLFYVYVSKFPEAKAMFERSLELNLEIKCSCGVADCYGHLGNLAKMEGDIQKAEEHYKLCYSCFRVAGMTPNALEALKCLNALNAAEL